MGRIWNDQGEAGRVLTVKTKSGFEASLYAADQAGLLNLIPDVKYVIRCVEHNKCAGFKGQRPARDSVRHTNLYCIGCGWDSVSLPEGASCWPNGAAWADIAPSDSISSGRHLRPVKPIESMEAPATEPSFMNPLRSYSGSCSNVGSYDSIRHPGWVEAAVLKMDRDPVQCESCGDKTRKRWAVTDGHKWMFNMTPIDGPTVRTYCSVRCAKNAHPDRIKSKWVANEISGGR